MIEGAGRALAAVAAYIDLNPVRAGLVQDPKDYRWSGYGMAVAGQRVARLGLQTVVQAAQGQREESLTGCLAVYRQLLYCTGTEEKESLDEEGRRVRGALPRAEVVKVLAAKGKLGLGDYLRCRVRYFCDGVALGSREFVEAMFIAHRARFGPRRKTGARPMRGLAEGGLFTVRDLRLDVFG